MDGDDLRLVVDPVDDSVVTNADAKEVLRASQFDGLARKGLGSECLNLAEDPLRSG